MKKQILITGASSGIGYSAAIHLAKLGFKVYAGARKQADLEKLEQAHENIEAVELDITNEAHRFSVISKIAGSQLFGLFNNAGIAEPGPLELLEVDRLRFQLEVNVTAQVAMTQVALPLLRNCPDSRIVFTGSQSGYITQPFTGAYSASKYALEAVADALRMELHNQDIHTILLQPGVIKTPIWDKTIPDVSTLKDRWPEKILKLYRPDFLKLEKAARKNINDAGSPVELVNKTVAEAFCSKNPHSRYRIGTDAKMSFALTKLVTGKLRDKILLKAIQYKSKS